MSVFHPRRRPALFSPYGNLGHWSLRIHSGPLSSAPAPPSSPFSFAAEPLLLRGRAGDGSQAALTGLPLLFLLSAFALMRA